MRSFYVHNTSPEKYAIRQGDWLLIACDTGYVSGRNAAWEAKHDYPTDDGGPVELYNLREDIGERNDVAASNPEKVAEMTALLKRIREQGYSAPRLER